MKFIKDFKWVKEQSVNDFVEQLGSIGFQSAELMKAANTVLRMKKNSAKIYLTFTSNMVTSGLRGLFAQQIKLGLADAVVTTVGSIEEDVMRAKGEQFILGSFYADDVELHEQGVNRVGNLLIRNESYERFESLINPMLLEIYQKKPRISSVELLHEIGSRLNDENSILYQAYKKDIPVFCPAITDGAFGFHLFMFQQDHKDFVVDVVKDFHELITSCSIDDKKGVIALGGGVSKHYAIFGSLINGGMDYAVYVTTARPFSGSLSGATTQEAKSWGKIKDDADASTVVGEASIIYPLLISYVFEQLSKEGLLDES
ncbi:MAG: deoxyhypusine synthase [Candidatus Nanoarchaeia archaeon]|jgi:deoxyhypusine synthase